MSAFWTCVLGKLYSSYSIICKCVWTYKFGTILFNSSRCLLIDYLLIINVQFRIIILIIYFLRGNVKNKPSFFHSPFNIFVILFMCLVYVYIYVKILNKRIWIELNWIGLIYELHKHKRSGEMCAAHASIQAPKRESCTYKSLDIFNIF